MPQKFARARTAASEFDHQLHDASSRKLLFRHLVSCTRFRFSHDLAPHDHTAPAIRHFCRPRLCVFHAIPVAYLMISEPHSYTNSTAWTQALGRDLRGEVYLCASALVVEVYDDTGWVSDGVDEMSGDHFVQGGLVGDRCPALSAREAMSIGYHVHQGTGPAGVVVHKQKATVATSNPFLPPSFSFPMYLRCFPVESLMVRFLVCYPSRRA